VGEVGGSSLGLSIRFRLMFDGTFLISDGNLSDFQWNLMEFGAVREGCHMGGKKGKG
jgi:hypothetical protein